MTASNVISNIVNRLKLQKDELEHSSFYREIPIGGDKLLVVRVSNHRTHLQTWADRYTKTLCPNKKMQRRMGENLPKVYRQKMFYSFVFEDENTVGNTEVNNGQVIVVLETVKNAQNLTDIQVSQIIDVLSTFMTNQHYNENILGRLETITNKIQENNNKQINTNKTVMKLNESQLRKIIQESIKKVLKENEEPLYPGEDVYTIDKQLCSPNTVIEYLSQGDYDVFMSCFYQQDMNGRFEIVQMVKKKGLEKQFINALIKYGPSI